MAEESKPLDIVIVESSSPSRNVLLSTSAATALVRQGHRTYFWRPSKEDEQPVLAKVEPIGQGVEELVIVESSAPSRNVLLSTSAATALVQQRNTLFVWKPKS